MCVGLCVCSAVQVPPEIINILLGLPVNLYNYLLHDCKQEVALISSHKTLKCYLLKAFLHNVHRILKSFFIISLDVCSMFFILENSVSAATVFLIFTIHMQVLFGAKRLVF